MISDPGIRLFLLKNLSRNPEGGYRWKMNLPAIRANYHEILEPIDVSIGNEGPTLFIRAGDSGYVLEEDWPDILTGFPNAELATIEGAGHWLHAERPGEFVKRVQEFMGEHDGSL